MRDTERDDGRIRELVRRVRRRWRLRVALRGLAWAAGLTLAVLFLSSLALERLRFAPEAVLWLRVLTWGTAGASLLWFLVLPLARRLPDERVALYLEEHEPSLDLAVVTALEAERTKGFSPSLRRGLVDSAMGRARRVEYGRRVEQGRLYRFGGALTAVAVAALAVGILAPEHLRLGVNALVNPTVDAAAVNPYAVAVSPGDVTIARGTDQLVTASLVGFESMDASVFTRTGPDGTFQRLSMLPGMEGGFEVLLLGVSEPTQYFVESTGIRSPTYTIDVADLPFVDRLDLTYRFPAYTGLEPRTVEDGGDVAALPGTVVEVRITPTVPSAAGRLVMEGDEGAALEEQGDGTLAGTFTVGEPGFYSVELARDNGQMVSASPEYAIDVLEDQPPSVRFARPGRDTPASPIEEVYLEVGADDDYGVGDIRLVVSVNGGAPDTVSIFEQGGAPLASVSAGHTLFLEEFTLDPGDLVAYYAVVRDNRNRQGGAAVVSDMYFVNIRPFERAYRQGDQMGGGQPQGGGQMPGAESALSELQRQIVAATFNLIRQRGSYSDSEFGENVVSVGLAQARLQEQVGTLLRRMTNRGIAEAEPGFRDVAEALPRAAQAMDSARAALDDQDLDGAIPHEQSALRYLQQAEETYERIVVQQQQQAGGGGGQQSAAAEDLADLFELELDRMRNQYETVQRGQQQTADETVDEVLEKLQELARRQEQEAERQRRRAQQSAQGAPRGGGQSQRDLAEEVEETARELQRLAREQNNAELEQTARDLQRAAESMRRSAAESGSAGSAEARSALDRLEEARRRLQRNQADRARRDAEDALEQVDDLLRQQRDVQRDVREMPADPRARGEEVQRLIERKNQMTEAVQNLERQLDRAGRDAQAENPEAAQSLRDAAEGIRESKLKEKIQYSRGTVQQRDPETASTLEMAIEGDLHALRERLERARDTAGRSTPDPLEEALEQTRELVRGMEAMDRRLRESGQRGSPGETGEGEAGRPGEAEEGEEGRPGEPDEGRPGGEPGEDRQAQAGQEGQPGGQQAGRGGQPADARDAGAPMGGATRGDPRGLSEEEIRQYTREFGQRSGQLRDLRNQLRQAGRPVEELQAVLDAMERLAREGAWDDPATVAGLNEEIIEMLKRLEFGLRREVEGEGDRRATLTGSDEVPAGYRALVEEYYRALARSGGPGGRD